VLFNNAGIYHPGKDWLDVPPDQFDDTMSVNVRVRVPVGGEAADRRR
jgi:NAD(P)-dependent dehydrogenase (short-subunit alcohol dehydrogenase family)